MSFDGASAIIIIDRREGLVFLAIVVLVPEDEESRLPEADGDGSTTVFESDLRAIDSIVGFASE